ncbi:MAG: UvrB/UvrC motif-containing protein [Thermoflavifilum sp.]|nr:UvrB/UvrC motif-containing protein [Thermoflavifilum sp.]MCL6513577.1 UvrB/UvrC motif-containing protein [Alicyclobacillus sp.]
MLCQRCHERPANVQFTQIINGDKKVYHLCEQCAREAQGDLFGQAAQAFNFDFHQWLGHLMNMESSPGFAVPAASAQRCGNCGMTYQQFTQLGRFGCPKCYDNFAPRLEPLLRRIQSATSHTGKVPLHAGSQVKVRKNLERLRKELQQAVAMEQYERAAQLRDQIRELEQQMDRG